MPRSIFSGHRLALLILALAATAGTPALAADRIPTRQEAQREFEAWDKAATANTPAALEAFLRQYPNGRYAGHARAKIVQLGAASGAAPAPPASVSVAAPSAPGTRPSASELQAEFELFDRALISKKPADYQAYLRKYPDGRYASRARAALSGTN